MTLIWDSTNPLWCAFTKPLVEGRFIERPNRFVAFVEIEGEVHRTHVPDPGRLKELLFPGVRVYLEEGGITGTRKTRYSLCLVESADKTSWVSLNTQLPNRIVRLMLEAKLLPQFSGEKLIKPEFTYHKSQFDFLLESETTNRKRLLEVKSVTLVREDGTAMFPDAPTERGTRHLRELISAKLSGEYETSVLFVVQRPDAHGVSPNGTTDPMFYQAVSDAMEAGVDFTAIAYTLSSTGVQLNDKSLPVMLEPESLQSVLQKINAQKV